jgi:hypothetical protein
MATQISAESRMFNLKCVPNAAPTIKDNSGAAISSNLYTWSADKVVFKKGLEGTQVSIQYKCYTGPK